MDYPNPDTTTTTTTTTTTIIIIIIIIIIINQKISVAFTGSPKTARTRNIHNKKA